MVTRLFLPPKGGSTSKAGRGVWLDPDGDAESCQLANPRLGRLRSSVPRMRTGMTILTGVLLLVSCGGADAASTTSSTSTTTPTTATEPTTTTMATSTSTAAGTATTAQTIDVSIESGEVVGPTAFSFTVGDAVSIWVVSDVDAEIHVDGYDVFFEAAAGVPTEVALTADVPGIFEVELEGTHTPLFALEVTP